MKLSMCLYFSRRFFSVRKAFRQIEGEDPLRNQNKNRRQLIKMLCCYENLTKGLKYFRL